MAQRMAQEKWLIDGQRTIDIAGVRRLKVGLVAGHVDIVAHDDPNTRVEVHSVFGRELKVTLDGDRLEIDHPQLRWDNFIEVFRDVRDRARVDISILVPRETALTLGVISAEGLVSGLHEDTTASTVSGDLVIDGVRGDLGLNSVSGEITVRAHHGAITAKTVNGELAVEGEILSFRSESVNGDVLLDTTGVPDEVRINTISGDLTARFAADTPARYTVNTVSGEIRLDGTTVRKPRGRHVSSSGQLDRRWVELRANTVSGDVNVLRRVRA